MGRAGCLNDQVTLAMFELDMTTHEQHMIRKWHAMLKTPDILRFPRRGQRDIVINTRDF